ncbi:acetyltransferase [Capronia epimyces CBS 606.96]|uniref:Acetyltransferase n=1 Tax=Capronia epimyces CBS 606.96 TaxID=1182542 RepID=W9XV50_9EURO|nr:acetyltransferase [Capronia epimyces CBS 606.96]EXJ80851.1 acetyltransferase [Capronia epimyces CBS 606.96]
MAEIQTRTYTIRYARQSDVPVILQLIQELAEYEKSLHEVGATEESLRATLSFPEPSRPSGFTEGFAKTLLISPRSSASAGGSDGDSAEQQPEVAGMALFFHNYSTWTAAPGIYLEDLFVRPQYRGTGFGTALIQALARECLRLGCKRLDWSVLKWNTPSIEFYTGESIGATRMEEWVGMRVDTENLPRLAAKGERAK